MIYRWLDKRLNNASTRQLGILVCLLAILMSISGGVGLGIVLIVTPLWTGLLVFGLAIVAMVSAVFCLMVMLTLYAKSMMGIVGSQD